MTTVSEGAAAGSPKASWVFMLPSRKRTGFDPQAPPGKALHFRGLPPAKPKNRTGIGPHPKRAKTHTSAGKGAMSGVLNLLILLVTRDHTRPRRRRRVSEFPLSRIGR